MQAQKGGEMYLQPIRNLALEGGGWPAPHFGRFTPAKNPVFPLQVARRY
jgi:hypothetical protein